MELSIYLALMGPGALLAVALLPRANASPRRIAGLAFVAACAALAIAVLCAASVAVLGAMHAPLLGVRGVGASLHLDIVSAAMFVLVAFVGATVIRFSRNYLDGDPNQGVFMQRMAATVASVQLLVIAGNVALLIVAWIATSLCLNKLLLFYGNRPAAVLAARKKFVVSRLGDIALIGAAALLYGHFGTLEYPPLLAAPAASSEALVPIAALIVAAAVLKSAQFPLHGWILEVMETPTPVSALLHAGIINAGGFLVIRFSELIIAAPAAMHALALIGGVTALFGSLVMLTQTSVKVSLAYSTIAQMGFMLLQCGLGAFASAFLHIVAHSLYKAHAFLSSGSVIDLLRASWSPSPSGKPHPARFIIALGAVLALALFVSAMFGATLVEKPGVFVLGAVLLMGLTLLVASAIDERANAYVVSRTGAAALGVGALYFALQAAAEYALAGAVAETRALQSAFDAFIVGFVVISFAAVTLAQSQLGWLSRHRLGRAAYVHLSNGLYTNTLANRWALRFWPLRRPRTEKGVRL